MMMGLSRERRATAIARELRVEAQAVDGRRPIRRRRVALGMLGRRGPAWTLHWRLDQGDPWREYHSELRLASPEVAELWAVSSLARLLAMFED